MADKTNFMQPPSGNPNIPSQGSWTYTPSTVIFEAENVAALTVLVNDLIANLALPEQEEPKFYLRNIDYSSAQKANMLVSYSALLHIERWEKI